MANEVLRQALYASGLTVRQVAQELSVDQKTVERWIAQARLPYPRHRFRLAARLGHTEAELWPEAAARVRSRPNSSPLPPLTSIRTTRDDLACLYPHRAVVPSELWSELLESATQRIDVLAYTGLFVLEQHPELPALLQDKAKSGVKIRLLLGDPRSEAVRERSQEEGQGDAVAARVRRGLALGLPLAEQPGVTVRLHRTTLYASIYQFDEDMLVNTHVYGLPPSQAPVLHLHRSTAGSLFETYIMAFERVWQNSRIATSTNGF